MSDLLSSSLMTDVCNIQRSKGQFTEHQTPPENITLTAAASPFTLECDTTNRTTQ